MAFVVIGANFGDEGKGLITDALVRRTGAPYVARFNGGAQAGHTVVDGPRRHVFGHVGAGAFAGARTLLTSQFIVNPLLLRKELKVLGASAGPIFIDARARVSTIFEMMLNAMTEMARGSQRHGSCGVGINETVNRHKVVPISTAMSRLSIAKDVTKAFDWFQEQVRARELEQYLGHELFKPMMEVSIQEHANDIYEVLDKCFNFSSRLDDDEVVYEGAQGLALDEFMGKFPHVTRSMTGLPYAIMHAHEVGIKSLTPVYVTRAYLTRHGAGELPCEHIPFHDGPNPLDPTNQPNAWQGSLRYAPLNLPMMRYFINADRDRARVLSQVTGVTINPPVIALTCLDQIHGQVKVVTHGAGAMKLTEQIDPSDLPGLIEQELNLKILAVSLGPTASNVNWVV
jgi:adenylosuccinate synthase